MCGIGGFYNQYIDLESADVLIRMTDKVKHRGPDSEGYFHFLDGSSNLYLGSDARRRLIYDSPNSGLFFGHRRLSIIDLSDAGIQPLVKHDLALLFNGEIYNYLEIREELIQVGISFKTNTDSEVILSAYHIWKEDAFKKFNGMWSIVIFDIHSQSIILSRDRFGIKPLYYYIDDNRFVFSSEIKQILTYGVKPIINKTILDDYLLNNKINHTDETFFKGIRSIPSSSSCRLELRNWPSQ
jgi:asparagine synthase (glutamine-hydrolysing)